MSRYYDEEDMIAEYEKQLQKKDNIIEILSERIDKAIELINAYYESWDYWDKLLEILKGSEDNEKDSNKRTSEI